MPLKTVASFKRMREFQTYGDEWLLQALKESKELEVDESDANIRRNSELKEPKGQFERSIYAVSFQVRFYLCRLTNLQPRKVSEQRLRTFRKS